jgi:hypothetical protein
MHVVQLAAIFTLRAESRPWSLPEPGHEPCPEAVDERTIDREHRHGTVGLEEKFS